MNEWSYTSLPKTCLYNIDRYNFTFFFTPVHYLITFLISVYVNVYCWSCHVFKNKCHCIIYSCWKFKKKTYCRAVSRFLFEIHHFHFSSIFFRSQTFPLSFDRQPLKGRGPMTCSMPLKPPLINIRLYWFSSNTPASWCIIHISLLETAFFRYFHFSA